MNAKLLERVNELKIQAMMFDMDIDYETLELEPKHKDTTPVWVKAWRDKEHNGDRQPQDYQGWA